MEWSVGEGILSEFQGIRENRRRKQADEEQKKVLVEQEE